MNFRNKRTKMLEDIDMETGEKLSQYRVKKGAKRNKNKTTSNSTDV